jgi:CRP/FNR family cyclic AMP-dependent transcriptional regulator
MAAIISAGVQLRREDSLAYLPVSGTKEYRGNQLIFGPDLPSNCIYLVVLGKVGLSHLCADGSEVLLDIVLPDELFGESAFINVPKPSECATAIGKTTIMSWPTPDIEELVMRRPQLGLALIQMLAGRSLAYNRQIESFSLDNTERRLARLLIRFADRLGIPEDDGSVRMMPFTHEALAGYVGTSREIVTQYMNQVRRDGFISYSRRGIVLHRDSLRTVLEPLRAAFGN